jgi:hypothetical protein
MIDWDSLVLKPCMQVFGEPATYNPASGGSLPVAVVFDDAYMGVEAGGMVVVTSTPLVGIRLSEFPAGFDPEAAQGDRLTITRTGHTYVVKEGRDDSHGWARLDLNKVS